MTRYINQNKKCASSCVPIAIMNSLKWAGKKVTKKDLAKFHRLVNKPRARGVQFLKTAPFILKQELGMDSFPKIAMAHHGRTFKRESIDKELEKGNAVLLNYYWYVGPRRHKRPEFRNLADGIDGHCMLIIGKRGNRYVCVNSRTKNVVGLRSSGWIDRRLAFKYYNEKTGIHAFAMGLVVER